MIHRRPSVSAFFGRLLPALVLVTTAPGQAHMGGMFDCARPDEPCPEAGMIGASCGAGGGSCHGGLLPENTTTQLYLDGLPPEGYAAGETYDLIVYVLGVSVPIPITGCPFGPVNFPNAFNNFAGFNLHPSAGILSTVTPEDGSLRILNETECEKLRRLTGCGLANFPPCPACDDSTVASSQATHSQTGNKQFSWSVRWQAPESDGSPVTFHLAGNVVNGNCRQDAGDLWAVSQGYVLPAGTGEAD